MVRTAGGSRQTTDATDMISKTNGGRKTGGELALAQVHLKMAVTER